MKRFLLVFGIAAVVAIALVFIDKYLVEVPFAVLAIACVAAGTVSNLVFFVLLSSAGCSRFHR